MHRAYTPPYSPAAMGPAARLGTNKLRRGASKPHPRASPQSLTPGSVQPSGPRKDNDLDTWDQGASLAFVLTQKPQP